MLIKNINVNKLHDEFIANGIFPHPVLVLENGDGYFTFSDGTDMDLVQSIIDNHNPEPEPEPPTLEERLKASEQAILDLIKLLMGGVTSD